MSSAMHVCSSYNALHASITHNFKMIKKQAEGFDSLQDTLQAVDLLLFQTKRRVSLRLLEYATHALLEQHQIVSTWTCLVYD